MPKKDAFKIVRCHEHIEILINGVGDQLFFRQRDSAWMPTLRLLHKFPFFLPMLQVDKGAIRFVLSGANIMCPGLTSPGAVMTPVDKGNVVAIMAEGKQHALAIGQTILSTDDMYVFAFVLFYFINSVNKKNEASDNNRNCCCCIIADQRSTRALAWKTVTTSTMAYGK